MSKYANRLKSLHGKFYSLISQSDFCAIREYYKYQFEEIEKPDDFERQYQIYEKWKQRQLDRKDQEAEIRINEMNDDSRAFQLKYSYRLFEKVCRMYPFGRWQPKSFRDVGMIKAAKKYLQERKDKK